MITDRLPEILERADRGDPVETIAADVGLSLGYIYGILRRERPKRERKPRERTSQMPAAVLGLYKRGIKPARIAALKGVSRAYVYRILTEAEQETQGVGPNAP